MKHLVRMLWGLVLLVGCQSPPSPTTTPTAPQTQTEAVYQTFEHGWMVWFADGACAYSFATDMPQHIIVPPELGSMYIYCVPTAGLVADPVTPPAGLFAPDTVLLPLWNRYESIRAALGFAAAEAQQYMAAIPQEAVNTLGGGPFSLPVLTLPDGQVLWCGFRAASAGSCYLAA